ncbi:uncharacterized protein LOC114539523 [Dendronephthya gigantea]|uniref:uncharacterized protein LOC114539523 n=1 Tax=Dendronephthya gigantea TaxID=151771 RepID=UPI00106CEE96|nr:uncharacterized protein LOC114539523 [Dendronephthya gigantea]
MSAGRRTDVLTDALLHYGARQLRNFGTSLQAKLKRCSSIIVHTLSQIQELFSKLPVAYDPFLINTWMEEERKCIQERNSKKMRSLTWEEQYVQNLLHLYQLRAQIGNIPEGDHSQLTDVVKKSKKVLKAVQRIEKQQKLKKRWKTGESKFNAAAISLEQRRQESVMELTYSSAVERMFLISLKNKYADGQAIAVKLSKQISQRTNAIKAAVTRYNASLNSLEDWIQELPAEMQFEEAKDPNSVIYSHLNHQQTNDTVPSAVKRAAIDSHNS